VLSALCGRYIASLIRLKLRVVLFVPCLRVSDLWRPWVDPVWQSRCVPLVLLGRVYAVLAPRNIRILKRPSHRPSYPCIPIHIRRLPRRRSFTPELALSTLLSPDDLFELFPFSGCQLPFPKPKPDLVPTTNFSSIAFMYRLPNFSNPQPQPQTSGSTQENLQHLEAQLALLHPKCDLSSFEVWKGDEVLEMQMTDGMLDEIGG
jgi:hypothetical protein